MLPADAAKLLDLPVDATPEQLEARFLELRTKLEDKIAKAPTPGLKAKYRESLESITTAFETLTLAADSSFLPVAQKQGAGSNEQGLSRGGPVSAPAASTNAGWPLAGGPAAPRAASSRRKSGGKEFLVVTVVAILLLAGGGWFVMKTRLENEEKARAELEARQLKEAEAIVQAQLTDRKKSELRAALAEARVDWEAHESALEDAERRTNELKSELRGLRDAPPLKKIELSAEISAQELYTQWLKNLLLRHPAKISRARAEEAFQAGNLHEAEVAAAELGTALGKLAEEVESRRNYFFKTTASLSLLSKPAGVRWTLTDAYGRTQEGKTPAQLTGLPLTHLAADGAPENSFDPVQRGEHTAARMTVRFSRTGWADVVREITAFDGEEQTVEALFPQGSVQVNSLPAGVPFKITQILSNHGWTATGTTPATVSGVPTGRVRVTLARPGYGDVFQNLDIEEGKTAKTLDLDHRSQTVEIRVAESARILVDGKVVGTQVAQVAHLTPGEHTLQLETSGYPAYRTKFKVAQAGSVLPLNYSFRELAVENLTCSPCNGKGSHTRQVPCYACGGKGWYSSPSCCDERGQTWGNLMSGMVRCNWCGGDKRRECSLDTDGCRGAKVINETNACRPCAGDGKVSRLQLGI